LALTVESVIDETNMKPDTMLEFCMADNTAPLDDTVDATREDADIVLIVIVDAVNV
jgi:hypothetical protein